MSLFDGIAVETRFPQGLVVEPGVEGAGAPLGNTTVLASTSMDTAFQKSGRKGRRLAVDHAAIVRHQYELLDFLYEKLPDPGQGYDEKEKKWKRVPGIRWRVRSCKRIPVMGGDVEVIRSSEGKVHYGGLNKCDSVWTCPVCSSRVAGFRRQELSTAIETNDCWVALSTFTVRHSMQDQLGDLIKIVRTAYRSMRSGRHWEAVVDAFGLVGSYTAMEFTWSRDNGWHPHLHALDVFREELDEEQRRAFREMVNALWIHAIEMATGRAISKGKGEWQHGYSFTPSLSSNMALVQAFYAVKWGSSEEQWTGLMKRKAARSSSGHVVMEVTGSLTKQGRVLDGVHYSTWELLDIAAEGSVDAWQLWFEFAQATRNLHQGSWSRGLRGWLGLGVEVPDADVPDAGEDPEVVATIDYKDWFSVLRSKHRGEVLQLAARGGTSEEVCSYVDWVCGRGR